jgi:hypothetical protein
VTPVLGGSNATAWGAGGGGGSLNTAAATQGFAGGNGFGGVVIFTAYV